MPVRDQVRDAQPPIAALDANYHRATIRRQRAIGESSRPAFLHVPSLLWTRWSQLLIALEPHRDSCRTLGPRTPHQ